MYISSGKKKPTTQHFGIEQGPNCRAITLNWICPKICSPQAEWARQTIWLNGSAGSSDMLHFFCSMPSSLLSLQLRWYNHARGWCLNQVSEIVWVKANNATLFSNLFCPFYTFLALPSSTADSVVLVEQRSGGWRRQDWMAGEGKEGWGRRESL